MTVETLYRLKGRGDCECCPNSDVELYTGYGSTLLCKECVEKEKNATALSQRSEAVRDILNNSRVQDAGITIKADIHNARTVAIVALKDAIWADESIAPEARQFVFAKECMARFESMQKAVFEARAELTARETEMRMWQIQTQTAAGALRTELREQFKTHDVRYQPVAPKGTPKPKSVPSTKTKKFGSVEKAALYEACKKYGVDAVTTQMTMITKNLTAEQAARHVAEKMGLLK